MAEWSGLHAYRGRKQCRFQDFLPVLIDFVTLCDFAVCAGTGVITVALNRQSGLGLPARGELTGSLLRDLLSASIFVSLMLRDSALADPGQLIPANQLALRAATQCILSFSSLALIDHIFRPEAFLQRSRLIVWCILVICFVVATRYALALCLVHLRQTGTIRDTVVILGANDVADRLASQICSDADIVGVYDMPASDAGDPSGTDSIRQVLEIAREERLDAIVLAVEQSQPDEIRELVERLKALPVQVAMRAESDGLASVSSALRIIGGIPMTVVADRPIKGRDLVLKALVDKFGAAFLLILLLPLMIGIAIVIAATSPGPVIFRQERQGWCGRSFVILKFRTMHVQSTPHASLFQTQHHDARCTRPGRFLRETSLDELPQLWNVLLGDMSLVGPRPHMDSLHGIGRAGREIVAEYALRYRVKPGMTGLAQINGSRGATFTLEQLRRRIEYDLHYIENWSIWLDLKILLRTPFCLIGENVF